MCLCVLDGDGEHYMEMGCGYGENIFLDVRWKGVALEIIPVMCYV